MATTVLPEAIAAIVGVKNDLSVFALHCVATAITPNGSFTDRQKPVTGTSLENNKKLLIFHYPFKLKKLFKTTIKFPFALSHNPDN